MDAVELRFLGPVSLLVDGAHVTVDRAKTRALLALLALHPGTPVSAQTLIEFLWNDALPRRPADALRTVVARARKALGDDRRLAMRGSGYVLDLAPGCIDLHRFAEAADQALAWTDDREALARALELWTGEPFDDCGRVRRLRFAADDLHGQRWALVERLLQALLRAGDPAGAVATGLPLLDERPDNDRVGALVALALARTGRVPEARSLIARQRALLLAEDPGADFSYLDTAAARLDGDAPDPPSLTPIASPVRLDEVAPPNPLAGHVVELCGRQSELELLRDLADRAAGTTTVGDPSAGPAAPPATARAVGPGQAVVVIGEPGIGKTALAASFVAQLAWPLRCIRCGPGSPEGLADLAGPTITAVAGPASDVAATRSRAVIAELERRAVDTPQAVVIDDLQWASEVDLLTLRGLIRAGLPSGVLLLITVRPLDGLSNETSRVIADVLREPTVRTVGLDALTRDDVRQLVRRQRPGLTPREITRIFELTRGNAFAVRCLLDTPGFDVDQPIHDLPAAVVLVTEQRLAGLDGDSLEALELATLLDSPIDLHALASLVTVDRAELAARLRPAYERHLLVEDRPGEMRFDHELTRQAVQHRLNPPLRRVLHDRLASHFLTDRTRRVLAGRHLVQSLPDSSIDEPVPVLLAAAEEALTTQRYATAIECFAAAEELTDNPMARRSTELRRGLALELAGRRTEATELYDRVADEALADDDLEHLTRAALAGLAEGVVGGDQQRRRRLELAAAHPVADERSQLQVTVQLGAELAYAGEELSPHLEAHARSLASDDPADQALLSFFDTHLMFGRPSSSDTVARWEHVEHLATGGGDLGLALRALEARCSALLALGDIASAREQVARLDRRLRRTPAPRQRWASALLRALLADFEGGLATAVPLAGEALNLGRDLELPDATNAFAIFKLAQHVRTGRLERLEPLVRAAAADPRSVPAWHAVHAATLRAADQVDEAIAAIGRFRRLYVPGRTRFTDLAFAMVIAASIATPEGSELVPWAAEELAPWSGTLIVVGSGAGCFGPTDLYLALAAAAEPHEAATWAGAWHTGAWAGLADQLAGLSRRRAHLAE